MRIRGWILVKYIALATVLAFLVALTIGFVDARRSVALTMHHATAYKLRHAFQMYLTLNGDFPPRISGDLQFEKQASWRMLLQFAEDSGGSHYRRYESWKSDHNVKYAEQHRFVVYFSDPVEPSLPIPTTTFVAVSDLESILQDGNAVRSAKVTDGVSNTLLAAQVPQSDIPWPEPRDMTFDQFCRTCDDRFDSQSNSATVGYAGQLLLFADGIIVRVSRPLPLSHFRGLWTRSAGDGPDRASLIRGGYLEPRGDQQFDFDESQRDSGPVDLDDAL